MSINWPKLAFTGSESKIISIVLRAMRENINSREDDKFPPCNGTSPGVPSLVWEQ